MAISLNKNHHFEIFVTTRDSQSPIAQALSSIGINVMTANNWEGDALAEVMRECWGLFINIDSDNPVSMITEHFHAPRQSLYLKFRMNNGNLESNQQSLTWDEPLLTVRSREESRT